MLPKGRYNMKKKMLVTAILLAGLFLPMCRVLAYNPNCLPGGDNYLSSDNFVLNGDQYETIAPFLVKPYTDYLFSFPEYYESVEPYINIGLYTNSDYMDELCFTYENFSYNHDYRVFFYSFRTGPDINYISVTLYDGGYITTNGFNGFILEEGTTYDGYERYIEGATVDTDAPYFQGTNTIVSYVDTPITVAQIQSALTAYDAIDGDLTASIVMEADGYTPNNQILGTYIVSFSATDSSGNKNTVDIIVEVVDVVSPVFGDIGTIIAVYPNVYSPEDIKAMLNASDNYDGDISSYILLTSDGYSSNNQTVGSYQMEFSVSDSSGNLATHTVTVEVVDQEAPVISGISEINIGYDAVINSSYVKSELSVIDNYDPVGSMSLVLVSDTYSANSQTIGNYAMVFEVYDQSGNRSEKTVLINVVDSIVPIVYFDTSVIQVYSDSVLTLIDITKILGEAKELDMAFDYDVFVLYDSYSRHASVPGTYHISLRFVPSSGGVMDKNLQICVIDRTPDFHVSAIPEEGQTEGFFSRNIWYILTTGVMIASGGIVLTIKLVLKKKQVV